MKRAKEIVNFVYHLYDSLPQEVKVSLYGALATLGAVLINEAVKLLEVIDTKSILAVYFVNVAMVFLKETKKRLDTRKS